MTAAEIKDRVLDAKYVTAFLQVILVGGTMLWAVGEIKGDIRVLQVEISYLKQQMTGNGR